MQRVIVKWVLAILLVFENAAFAITMTEPGETIGLALGVPFPVGYYFFDTASYISIPQPKAPPINVMANIPVFAMVTDKQFLKGRFELFGAVSQNGIKGNNRKSWHGGFYNPSGFAGLAWDLGQGFGFSDFIGTYVPLKTQGLAANVWGFNNRCAITYFKNGYNLTAHTILGFPTHDLATHKPVRPNYMNVDLTATSRIKEKYELGLVGFGTWEYNASFPQQEQALGALIGYHTSTYTLQFWLTHGLHQRNYGGESFVGFVRLIIDSGHPLAI